MTRAQVLKHLLTSNEIRGKGGWTDDDFEQALAMLANLESDGLVAVGYLAKMNHKTRGRKIMRIESVNLTTEGRRIAEMVP